MFGICNATLVGQNTEDTDADRPGRPACIGVGARGEEVGQCCGVVFVGVAITTSLSSGCPYIASTLPILPSPALVSPLRLPHLCGGRFLTGVSPP